jgi:hypothetical protein
VQVQQRPTAEPTHHIGISIVEWLTGLLGVLSLGLGVWIHLAPEDGTLRLLGWEWQAAGIDGDWSVGLLIGGALLLSVSVASYAAKQTAT